MNKEILNAIISLEDLVEEAKELHAITLIQYDSFIESDAFSNNSEVYKTITSIIEKKANNLCDELQEKFDSLHALMRESVKNEKCPL